VYGNVNGVEGTLTMQNGAKKREDEKFWAN